MKQKRDNPGVYLPPPVMYALIFFLSLLLQRYLPLSDEFLQSDWAKVCGIVFICIAALFLLPALFKFLLTRNTLVTILPAKSLQTGGIYSVSRNPMYVALLNIYTGLAFLKGTTWTFILIPLLVFIVNRFIIRKEEQYLERAFGQVYLDYRKKVRRWV